MGSNREQYQSFTPAIDLAAYKRQIKTGVGSPDKACGQNEGSFLACYLMQGLGIRAGSPAKSSAERLAFLADNEAMIARLIQEHHCQIRFEPNAQLVDLFKALADDIAVYEKLLALNYLTFESITGKQETFFHVYFKTANLNELEKTQEALNLLAKHAVDVSVVDAEQNTYALLSLKRLKVLNTVKSEATVLALRSLFDRLIIQALVNDPEKGMAIYKALAACYNDYALFVKHGETFGAKNTYRRVKPAKKARVEMLRLYLDGFALMGELGFDLATVLYEVKARYHQDKVMPVTGFRLLLHSSSLFYVPPETKRRYYRLLASDLNLHGFVSTSLKVNYAGEVRIVDSRSTHKRQLKNVVEFSHGKPFFHGVEGDESPYLFGEEKHGLKLPSVMRLVDVLSARLLMDALRDEESDAFKKISGLINFVKLAKGEGEPIDYNMIFYFLYHIGRETKDAMTVDGLLALLTDDMISDLNFGYSHHVVRKHVRKEIDWFFDSKGRMTDCDGSLLFFNGTHYASVNEELNEDLSEGDKDFFAGVYQLIGKVMYQYAHALIQKAKAGKVESEKFSNFLIIVSDEANYINAKDLYRQYAFVRSAKEFALPDLYLKQGEWCDLTVLDPRAYYQFERVYPVKFGFDCGLLGHTEEGVVVYESAKPGDHVVVYHDEEGMHSSEPLRLTSYRDLTVLRHLHQVGYSFDTPECEQAITELLTTHDLANPSFCRFMQCLAECGARFPVMVKGKSLTQYIAEKYPTITKSDRKQAANDYIQKVLLFTEAASLPELMEALPPSMGQKIPEDAKATVQALKAYLVSDEGIKQLAKAQEKAWYAFLRGVMSPIRMHDAALRQFLLATQVQTGQREMNGVDFIKLVDAFLKNLNTPEAEKALNKVYPVFAPVLVHMASVLENTIRLRLHDKMSGEQKEEAKPGFLDSLKVGLRKKIDMKLSAKAEACLEKVLTSLSALVLSPLPETIEARLVHLRAYEQLRAELLAIMNPENKASSIPIGSRTIRDAIKAFLLTEGDQASLIAIDEVMAQNINDYLGVDLKQAQPSAPPAEDELESAIMPEADDDGYVSPVVPSDEAQALQLVPGQITNNSMTMYGGREMPAPESVLPVAKQVTMFPEKTYLSAEISSKIEKYEAQIRKRFHQDELIAVIDKINAHIEAMEVTDPLLTPLICPLTKQVPFYPCGLKDHFVSLDLSTFKLHFGKTLEAKVDGEVVEVEVSERSLRLFEMQELMFFFTNLQLVARLLNLSVEAQPVLGLGCKK